MSVPEARLVPLVNPASPWAGLTKDRLTAKTSIDSSPEIERMVNRAVVRAKQGDRDAVRFLYFQYADNVYAYVRTIVCDHHDAEDVTQLVFAKLITSITRYRDQGRPFVGWLMRNAHNAAIDAVRARRESPAEEIHGAGETCSEDAAETAHSLREAIAALPEDQREVVVMRHVMGLTPVEIAARTGRTHASVYGLHHRGRRALCEELRQRDSLPIAHRRAAAA